jgi:type I protein arginine methyltransferase
MEPFCVGTSSRRMTTSDDELACDVEIENETESWDDWVDDGSDAPAFSCLFCDVKCTAQAPLHEHLAATHNGFSLHAVIAAHKLDMYGTIRLVNFLRKSRLRGLTVDAIVATISAEGEAAFRDDEYLMPVVQDDPLLYCLESADSDDDFGSGDDDDDDDDELDPEREEKHSEPPTAKATAPAPPVTVDQLQRENDELKQQLLKYTRFMRDLVTDDESDVAAVKAKVKPADNDTYYFDSYSHVGIHREMITDRVRTDAYRNAILNNPELFKGKVVLDVGCGTGILSMFAARAGAARVIGIDRSEMGTVARQIVADNRLEDVVTIVKGKVEELELPSGIDKVDVIISEWMGYCLLYESMLDTVLFARDKWLAPGGFLFPDKCSMHIQGAYDSQQRIAFWDDVYGFDMTAVKGKISIRDAFVEDVAPQDVLTDRALLKQIDIDHVNYDELDFRADFTLRVTKTSTLFGFVSSFDIGFERGCAKPEYFTTGVEGTPTHWHQVFFHIETPTAVVEGDELHGKWWVRRNAENPRFLDVEIEWKKADESTYKKQAFRLHD